MRWPASEGGCSVKNRGGGAGPRGDEHPGRSQRGVDLVLSVGAWWPPGGATAFYHITCRTPAAVRGVPGRSGRLSADGPCTPKTDDLARRPRWQPWPHKRYSRAVEPETATAFGALMLRTKRPWLVRLALPGPQTKGRRIHRIPNRGVAMRRPYPSKQPRGC
jgi:hypothetical protein